MRGHHIYIVNGKVVAGAVPKTKGDGAKKATKEQLLEHQATIDKEKGAAKEPAKKESTASRWDSLAEKADKHAKGAKDALKKKGVNGLLSHIKTHIPKAYETLKADAQQKAKSKDSTDEQKASAKAVLKHAASSAKKPKLTTREEYALAHYTTDGFLGMNKKLRGEGGELTDHEQKTVGWLDSALAKLPAHKGTTYRVLDMPSKRAFDKFMREHKEGQTVTYPSFTSTSTRSSIYAGQARGKNGIYLVIHGKSGRDLDGISGHGNEKEVLFPRDTHFRIKSVSDMEFGGKKIELEEVEEGAGKRAEKNPPKSATGSKNHAGNTNPPRNQRAARAAMGGSSAEKPPTQKPAGKQKRNAASEGSAATGKSAGKSGDAKSAVPKNAAEKVEPKLDPRVSIIGEPHVDISGSRKRKEVQIRFRGADGKERKLEVFTRYANENTPEETPNGLQINSMLLKKNKKGQEYTAQPSNFYLHNSFRDDKMPKNIFGDGFKEYILHLHNKLTGENPKYKPPMQKALFTKEELMARGQQAVQEYILHHAGQAVEVLNRSRNAYPVDWTSFNPSESDLFYIPVNRLKTPYQTELATNPDKVAENVDKMKRGLCLAPVIIGYDYDVHDGHHRIEASKELNYTHIPCIVGGNSPIDVQRAEEAYGEVWKSLLKVEGAEEKAIYRRLMSKDYYRKLLTRYTEILHETGNKEEAFNYTVEDFDLDGGEAFDLWQDLTSIGQNIPESVLKSIVPDLSPNPAFDETAYAEAGAHIMFRGVGQAELDSIMRTGYIKSKGKGNDSDQDGETLFTPIMRQAWNYAKSNYSLYNEPNAYIIVLYMPPYMQENELGELTTIRKVPKELIFSVLYVEPDERQP